MFGGAVGARRQDIVGVLQEAIAGIRVAEFLRSGHRVTTDELTGEADLIDRFVDGCLYASDICEEAVRADDVFQDLQAADIYADRSTEKDQVAGSETLIQCVCRLIDRPILHGGNQAFP